MNREIKFRGIMWESEEWAYGSLAINSHRGKSNYYILINGIGSMHDSFRKVAPETVGQYTGLKDKNGVEIFEGDVVKWDDCSDGRYWRIAIVRLNPDIQFDCSSISRYGEIENSSQHIFRFGNFIYKDTHNHLYVIGNVHDKLELIK